MFKKKALEPLIASILIIVITVILVTIVLSFGKEFTNKGLNKTQSTFEITGPSDKQNFIRFVEAQNGVYIFDYYPPNTQDINFTVVQYSYLGYLYIPLEPEYNFNRPGRHYIPLGIIDEDRFGISLALDDGTYLTFSNVTNRNLSPSPEDCPAGYIPVPGNHLYGTVGAKGGFCVMKYEGKVDQNGDGIGDVNTSCDLVSYKLWSHSTAGCNVDNTTRTLVSTPQGNPIYNVSTNAAEILCNQVNGHLITNDEWMTLARNIERIPENWTSGIVGTGEIYRGNTDGNPFSCLEATADDTNGYFGKTDGLGDYNLNQRRTLKLTNGETIWDMSGNMLEWVNPVNIILQSDHPDIINIDTNQIFSGTMMINYTGVDGNFQLYDLDEFNYKDLMLLNKDIMHSSYGVGRLAPQSGFVGVDSNTAFRRGGAFEGSYGPDIGILTLGLNFNLTVVNSGLRCAYTPQ